MIKILENTDLFEQDLRDWLKVPNNRRTFADYWTYFSAANKERNRIMGTQQSGYNAQQLSNSASAATLAPHNPNLDNTLYSLALHLAIDIAGKSLLVQTLLRSRTQ